MYRAAQKHQKRPSATPILRQLSLLLLASAAVAVFIVVPAAPVIPVAQAHDAGIPYWGPLLSCTGNYTGTTEGSAIPATCNSVCDLFHTAQHIINFVITLTLFIGVPGMVIAGGIMLMVGNPLGGDEKNKHSIAKKMIVSAVMGAAIVLGAYVILNTFLWLMGNGTGAVKVQWPNIECTLPPVVAPS